jgi:ABC-type dipeptide/oligopeptide/nickel transport system permease subunit
MGGGVGTAVGIWLGYRRGTWLDMVASGMVDALLAMPRMLLALVVIAVAGQNAGGLGGAVALSSLPMFARLARSTAMGVAQREYVTASIAIGAGELHVLRRHVWPNVLPILSSYGSLSLANAILVVTAVGFLGLGYPPPAPEWGSMMSSARSYLWSHPHLTLVPATVVTALTLSLARLADLGLGRQTAAVQV